MRRVRYSVAMSLDGYIAGPKEEYDWILMDSDIDFETYMDSFDTVLIGRKSYEFTLRESAPVISNMPTYVFSNTMSQTEYPGVTISDSPGKIVPELKNGSGKDIWLFGGGSLFGSLLELGLVDEVEVAIMPVLLGEGIPLLPSPASKAEMRLINHSVYEKTGIVFLKYSLIPD